MSFFSFISLLHHCFYAISFLSVFLAVARFLPGTDVVLGLSWSSLWCDCRRMCKYIQWLRFEVSCPDGFSSLWLEEKAKGCAQSTLPVEDPALCVLTKAQHTVCIYHMLPIKQRQMKDNRVILCLTYCWLAFVTQFRWLQRLPAGLHEACYSSCQDKYYILLWMFLLAVIWCINLGFKGKVWQIRKYTYMLSCWVRGNDWYSSCVIKVG